MPDLGLVQSPDGLRHIVKQARRRVAESLSPNGKSGKALENRPFLPTEISAIQRLHSKQGPMAAPGMVRRLARVGDHGFVLDASTEAAPFVL